MRVTIADQDSARCASSLSCRGAASRCARQPVARRPGVVVTLRSRLPSLSALPAAPPSTNVHPVKPAISARSAVRIAGSSVVGSGRAAHVLIATSLWRSPICSLPLRGGEAAPTILARGDGPAVQQFHWAVNFCLRAVVNFSVREHNHVVIDLAQRLHALRPRHGGEEANRSARPQGGAEGVSFTLSGDCCDRARRP